jgi:hypothetical protein
MKGNIMKFSEETLNVLKNFAMINKSILFRTGNTIRTIAPSKSVFAKANITETIPEQCAIYELPRLLGALSLFSDPDIDFGKNELKIKDGKRSISYTYADVNAIISAPEKDIKLPSEDITFKLTSTDFQNIVKAAGVLGLRNVVVLGDGEKMVLSARDVKNSSSDNYSIELGDTGAKYSIVFNVENLMKLLSRDYDVTICAKGISKFESKDVAYFVALETTSEYEG